MLVDVKGFYWQQLTGKLLHAIATPESCQFLNLEYYFYRLLLNKVIDLDILEKDKFVEVSFSSSSLTQILFSPVTALISDCLLVEVSPFKE